jgi:N-hydroxyarylamine O-acetyltransferase
VDISAYLRRIAYDGPTVPSAETLRRLHRAHLLAVPFENLDIARGREIVLEEEVFFQKIVVHGRGGFCYELNGLFAALLRNLGFPVVLLSARVPDADGHRRLEFDHLTLQVEADGLWLADVGFGDCFLEPLRLIEGLEQPQSGAIYRLVREDGRFVVERRDDADWNILYDFSPIPRELAEFVPMCRYHQTSPASHFTTRHICSRPSAEGRITLAGMRLIENHQGRRAERMLQSESEYYAILRQRFGVVLD